MDIRERLRELARLTGARGPVVSVYLNTRWADEHQRERVRVFLKNELRRAREAGPGLVEDLGWIEAQGELLVGQASSPEAHGVALFACSAAGLREVLPVRIPFEDALVVADQPYLTPLAGLLEATPPTAVAFVDGTTARLVVLGPDGHDEAVTLESEVDRRHSRGGWAQLAQSRYQRHIEMHRGEHFEAVGAALAHLVDEQGVTRVVLAGEGRTLAVFQRRLAPRLAGLVVGTLSAAKYEGTSALVERAAGLLAELEQARELEELDAILTEAAKGGRATAGAVRTFEAIARGAVHRLYVLKGAELTGGACAACGALQADEAPVCRGCGAAAQVGAVAATAVDRVIAAGGAVEVIAAHPGLEGVGGIAARLRYSL